MEVRERLLEAALKVFEEAGSRGATTRRIAAEAGVNEITLFRHFGSKGALLSEALAVATHNDEVVRLPEVPANPGAELLEWCRERMAHLRHSSPMIRTCMGEMEQTPEMRDRAGATPARLALELTLYLRSLRDSGMADADVDPGAAAAMLMGAMFSDAMGRDFMPDRYSYTPEEAPAKYVALLLRAIGADSTLPTNPTQ